MSASDGPGPPRLLGGGRYELVEQVGQGGMATVWRGRDTKLGADVAVKVIQGEGRALAIRSRRLIAEAKAMARVRHPHIVAMHDAGELEGGAYVVMDLVQGGTLEDRLDLEGPLPPRRVVLWMLQVLDALHAAHRRGIVHRDVKPSNILLDGHGRAMLADFGIALLADEDRHTRTGISMGSVAYMAPEQRLDARAVGPAADVYAAAATIYHLVTGATSVDLFTAEEDSPRWADVPAPLRGPLIRATRLDAARRTADAPALAAELKAVLDELPETDGFLPGAPAVVGGLTTGEGGSWGGALDRTIDPPGKGTLPPAPVAAPVRVGPGDATTVDEPPPRAGRRVPWALVVVVALLGVVLGGLWSVWDAGAPAPAASPEAPVAAEVAATSGPSAEEREAAARAEDVAAAEAEAEEAARTEAEEARRREAAARAAKARRAREEAAAAAEAAARSPVEGTWRAVNDASGVLTFVQLEVTVDGTKASAVWSNRGTATAPKQTWGLDGTWDATHRTLDVEGELDGAAFALHLTLDAAGTTLLGQRRYAGEKLPVAFQR
ncbi:MAG: serine/threonine protein kinase [Alphaproteobacteria bacterium]|nr:serine/threonine protein kinase [Alphaproteobacteria bacterium]